MPTPPTNSGPNLRRLLDSSELVFSSHPQVSHYFPSKAMEDARRRIGRAIDRSDGPALVVGAAGTGKSLLLQVLAAQYHKRFDVVLLACARLCTRRALLQTILFELGLAYQQRDEGQLRLGLLDHLLSDIQSPAGLLLLVDEAQALPIALLDELRVMTNLMRGGLPRVRLVLAGSPALEESFADPGLESFSQRLSARCYLAPMTREETIQFVRAQLAAAGAAPESVFAPDAYDSVFVATDGVPRLVNQVCDRALLLAEDNNCTVIDRQTIQAAWADLQQLPTTWSTPRESSGEQTQTSQVIEFGSLDDTLVNRREAEIVEPTELDSDDNDVVTMDATADFKSPRLSEPAKASGDRPQRAALAARDPANPFAELFDEEEVVLDSFAAWDEMFHAGTPRVENRRDQGLTTLVQAALEATPSGDPHRADSQLCDEDSIVEEDGIAEIDEDDGTLPDELPTNWPRLRLAIVSESAGPEQVPTASVPATKSPLRHAWHDSPTGVDSPILIVEEDSSAASISGPPVRRLAYQHLFSRLRSG
ncbi:MAG: AAA family ATPase [Pirellulales bacterium]